MKAATKRFRDSTLGQAVARYRSALVTVAVLSAVLNVLLLGGSIYMMMVYDSVLPSHSLPTLFGLLAMVTVVYLFQGLFDAMRSRILGSVAIDLDRQLSTRVQRLVSNMALGGARASGDGLGPMRDLEQVRGFLGGSGPTALIDLPWIVFFLSVLFLLHVWLGVAALAGTIVLLAFTWATERATKDHTERLLSISGYRNSLAENNLRHVELLTVMGMRRRMEGRWEDVNRLYLSANASLARTAGLFGGGSKIFRLFLQSMILTVGALLVIDGRASGGVIFASSILAGRALAPVDQAIGNWRGFVAARLGWHRLNDLFARLGAESGERTPLPAPIAELSVRDLAVAPPGTQRLTVQGIGFTLVAGSALGVVGPSAAGKSSLGRALIGIWRPVRGAVRLDGAAIDQWESDALGRHLGYLPQSVELMDGTVADNIARFETERDTDAVIAAARDAGVHDMIVGLADGYDTPVGIEGANLSAGQRQRVGLARALYGDPFLVLLDEPNSNLDADGEAALSRAVASVRARGGIAVVIAHRPAALAQVDQMLVLREGRMEAFGPRDEILTRLAGKAAAPPGGTATAANAPAAASSGLRSSHITSIRRDK